MCSGNLTNITVDILEQQLRNRNALCLILDCRPFLAYNESHILNSINIHCPPILRRRKNGYLPLRTIIPDVLTRERLSSKYFHTVILYDELTFNDNQIYKSNDDSSMINLVAKCLQQEADLKNVFVLEGGIQKFRQAYPQLCTNKEALRNSNLNKSPILGNLTWPLKSNSNNSNGLTLPNVGNGLKICCNGIAASQNYLSGSLKYQILINNNCTKSTCNYQNKSLKNINSSSSIDNSENILSSSNSSVNNELTGVKTKSIDMVDSPLITHLANHSTNHHFQLSLNQSHNHLHSNQQTTSSFPSNHYLHLEQQSATNQQQFNHQLINNLSGSCSQLNQLNNNFCQFNSNLIANQHSMSLSNLTNLSSTKSNSNENHCNCCLENNNNLMNAENRSWIPKFNSFGNDAPEPVEILPYLLLGSESHASQLNMLKRIGVTALLNVSHSCPNHFEKDFIYKCIPVQDSSFEDISVYFDDAIQFIDQIRENNGRVLVHCHAGISRSATICVAYIMSNMKLRMEEAYEFVKNRRRVVSPNFNFMGQLLSFEQIVFAEQKTAKKLANEDDQMDIEASTADLIDKNLINMNLINNNLNENNSTSLSIKLINNNNLISKSNDLNAINVDRNSNFNTTNCFTDTSTKLKNIFDFTTNCNATVNDLTINKLDFSPIKKLSNANITTPALLSPT